MGDADASREALMKAGSGFDAVSGIDETAEEKAIKHDLAIAMKTPSVIGTPVLKIEEPAGAACEPDVTKCPLSFTKSGGICLASSAYSGPCASEQDMSTMSIEAKLALARICKVEFPCAATGAVSAAGVMEPASFLAAKTMPVDGYKIRNSLYLTQPMRSPPQASVNVIEGEDTSKMLSQAKYHGIQNQITRLLSEFNDDVLALAGKR